MFSLRPFWFTNVNSNFIYVNDYTAIPRVNIGMVGAFSPSTGLKDVKDTKG